jgi:predicted transport protein
MLNNKADFILEYIHAFPSQSMNKQDVDWSQSRIIFIAPEFTRYQQYAIGFKDLGIQLWEVHKYSNGLLVFNESKSPFTKEPLTAITKRSPVAKRVTEEIKVYSEEDLLEIAEDKVKELYQELKSAIFNLGTDVEVRPTKKYIAFRRNKGFAGIVVLRLKLKIYLNINISQLQDHIKNARDVKDIGHYAHGDTELVITERSEIPYALSLIKQAYERN